MKTLAILTSPLADKELLLKCKKAILDVVPDAEVILYGSRARGDAQDDSDYDLLVLTDEAAGIPLQSKLIDSTFHLQLDYDKLLSIKPYNRALWNTPLYRAMPLHKNIENEGVIL